MSPLDDGEVLTQRGVMRWCPVHEMGWTHTTKEGWHWDTLRASVVRLALAWFGEQITVRVVPCPACDAYAESA